jgi:hypothetical protein
MVAILNGGAGQEVELNACDKRRRRRGRARVEDGVVENEGVMETTTGSLLLLPT